jgi:CTP:molybdopterin cytidylyltransferase MocA
MERRTAALVLARGRLTDSWQAGRSLKYKALVPINGIPMVEYVLSALQQSRCEKIFIVQGDDEGLQRAVRTHAKNIFINCDPGMSSYSHSLFEGLKQIAGYYGKGGLPGIDIMMVPCDVPLVNGGTFDRLIEANAQKECDVCISMIKLSQLKEKYPGRNYYGFRYHDLGEAYCIQNFAFISGDSLRVACYGGTRRSGGLSHTLPDNMFSDFARTIDYFVSLRGRSFLVLLVWWDYIRRLAGRKHIRECLLLLDKLRSGRYTTADGKRFIFLATGLMADYIESREVELSFDVDEPGQLAQIQDLQLCSCVPPV